MAEDLATASALDQAAKRMKFDTLGKCLTDAALEEAGGQVFRSGAAPSSRGSGAPEFPAPPEDAPPLTLPVPTTALPWGVPHDQGERPLVETLVKLHTPNVPAS